MTRILIIGAGLIGQRHIETVLAHPACTLAGVVEPDASKIPPGTGPIFTSIAEVDVPVDGAIIATPTALHAEHGAECAARGWHMLIEKPIAETVEQAQALSKTVAKHGVRCLVGHHRRYHPKVQILRDLIARGDIGDPITATLIWAVRKPDAYFNVDWRQTGGSPVMINIVHDLDLLRFVLGEITQMVALGSDHVRDARRVESGAVALRFASGACATISFADTAPSPWAFEAGMAENPNIAATHADMWWITGTKGGIAFPSLMLWSGSADWSQAPSPSQVEAGQAVPLDAQLDHFIDVIAGDAIPMIDLPDATETLRMTCALETLLTPDGVAKIGER